jgi:hypothetical protein
MVGPAVKRDAVAHLRAVMGLSERRACRIVAIDRKTARYASKRPADAELRAELRDLANARRRFGDRRLFVLLRQQGERTASARASTAACGMSCSTRRCSSASTTRERKFALGFMIITTGARTLPSAMRRWRTMQPRSPQQAIGCATPTSSADRLLLTPRPRAYQPPGLNSPLDETSGAGHLGSLKVEF